MDISVSREALLKPLQAISGVVDKKQIKPILSNVLLKVDRELSLIGTDTEIEFIGIVPVETHSGPCEITVSARKLFDICRALPEAGMLRLSLENNNLIIRCDESHFVLNTLPAVDFPNLEACTYTHTINMKQSALKSLLTRTAFAMGQQDVRFYLNGVFLEIANGEVKCVASDGHRLALMSLSDESLTNTHVQVIIPRKSVLEIMRLLDEGSDKNVAIEINDARMRIVAADYVFTTKLINAQYPDYNRLIRRGNVIATADRDMMKQALVRAAILSSEKYRGVRFQLESNKLKITANNTDQEQAEEEIALDYTGAQLEMGFNVVYLLEAISAIPSKVVRCVFAGSSHDGVVIEPAEEGDMGLYFVMPMRL
ncbi:MAG TPA: DNA polymerase III subunit beta [Gammaproteobacteria bacterium]|jgi:DNA polymerase-3 subunit beta|nr:DNA polymerase III subunit beta [Gammaproteobacteria bacterium]